MTVETLRVGAVLRGRYRLDAPLGRGGMGAVYRARDLELERDVAIKVIADSTLDTDLRERLLHEARAAASLNHPHLVAVHDVGEDGAMPFIVMELVDGESLRAHPPRDVPAVAEIARQLLSGLEHAHAHGIVHRDLKPENVLLAGNPDAPQVKIADFGVALSRTASRLTHTGAIVGTAAYLSPEQALGGAIDGRADLYALGVVLYELLAGRAPFEGNNALAVISQHLHAPVVPLRSFRPDVPPAFEAVVLRMLAKSPDQRPRNASEAAAALEAAMAGPTSTSTGTIVAPAPLPLLESLVRGRLVARGEELDRLRELWRSAREGKAQLALVSGEPGVGKTRLARELVVTAHVEGAAVLSGGCYEYEATTPYLPFVEALRGWVRGRGAESLYALLGDSRAELARLAPEIEARLGPSPPLPELEAHEERLRLFDAFTRFLGTLAAESGLLIFLDDLQWADQGTLTLLHYLLRHLRDVPLLVLATYREVELDRAHPLAAALVEWDRDRLATRVQLGRLSLDGTAALLATLLSQDSVSPEFAAVVHKETEGNPFFAEEVVKALIEQGQIYREAGEWNRRQIHELVIPQSVKAAIGRRLDRLSTDCADVLHTAAALGKTFAFEDVVAVTGRSEDAILDALDEAAAAQLVVARSGDTYVFTHDKIREVLYEEPNPVRRRRLHQRIGEALEARGGARAESRTEDLAHHFLQSGDLERALRYSLLAAERARKVFALDEAVVFLERARECADALDQRDRRFEVLKLLGGVNAQRGDATATIAACERALELAPDLPARASIRVQMGEILTRVGDARAGAVLQQALSELDQATQPRELAIATLLMGRIHHYRMEHLRSLEYLLQAERINETLQDPTVTALLYGYLAGAYQHQADYETSMKYAQLAVDLGTEKNLPTLTSSGHEFLAEDFANLGQWRKAIAHAEEDVRIGKRIGSLDRQAWGTFVLAWAFHGMGDLRNAIAFARSALQLCDRLGEKRLRVWLLMVLIPALAESGETDEADMAGRVGLESADALGQVALMAEMQRACAQRELVRVDAEAAMRFATKCLALKEGKENRVGRDNHMAIAAQAALLLGRTDEAEAHANAVVAFALPRGLWGSLAIARRTLASVAAARGNPEGALLGYAEAIALQEETESRLEMARTHLARAKVHDVMARDAAAERDRERALELFDACGAIVEAGRLRGN